MRLQRQLDEKQNHLTQQRQELIRWRHDCADDGKIRDLVGGVAAHTGVKSEQQDDDGKIRNLVGGVAALAGVKSEQQDDENLRSLIRQGGPKRSVGGKRFVKIDVHSKSDLRSISRALSDDMVLQKEIRISSNKLLARGMRLLKEGPLKGCVVFRAALEKLQPWVRLHFERLPSRPIVFPSRTARFEFQHRDWSCPSCLNPYPVQVPCDLDAKALISSLLPGVKEYLLPAEEGLWLQSEVGLGVAMPGEPAPPRAPSDQQGHVLSKHNPVPNSPSRNCSLCTKSVDPFSPMWGCAPCNFSVCEECYTWSRDDNHGSFILTPMATLEMQQRTETKIKGDRRLRLLVATYDRCFDLSNILHFGTITWPPLMDSELAASSARLCQRDPKGLLKPMFDPYDYYARAALLYNLVKVNRVPPLQLGERNQLLHEARGALLAALGTVAGNQVGFAEEARKKRCQRQFGTARMQNPSVLKLESKEQFSVADASTDPRLWYLMGLVLCGLGAFAEARNAYAEVLSRLPMAYFAHVVHFNIACIHARAPSAFTIGSASRVAAFTELKEFRRCCRGNQIPSNSSNTSDGRECCLLCGAPSV